jgi:hypothetical protein
MALIETIRAGWLNCWFCAGDGADVGPFHVIGAPNWNGGQGAAPFCRYVRFHKSCLEDARRSFDGKILGGTDCDNCVLSVLA